MSKLATTAITSSTTSRSTAMPKPTARPATHHPDLAHPAQPAADPSQLTHQAAITPIPALPAAVSLGTLQANHPAALVSGAAELACQLAQVIDQQKLSTVIKGKRFVNVEGWTTLATMLGVTAREIATTESDGIFTATVELVRMADGACISRASAECGSPDELDKYGKPLWSSRPRYARRSMAQTRATGKACRLAFSWIMSLAGYEVTPAEEMAPAIEAEADTRTASSGKGHAQTFQTAQTDPTAPPPKPNLPTRITASQLRLLEAQVRDYHLDISRVEASVKRAWQLQGLADLNPQQFEELLVQLEKWAAQEYARAEAVSAHQRDAVAF